MTTPQQPELPAPDLRGIDAAPYSEWRTFQGFRPDAMLVQVSDLPKIIERAVLADRERRKVVAWRYIPSPTWGEYVITQDPKVAEDARACGIEVEEMTVDRHSKVEDSNG